MILMQFPGFAIVFPASVNMATTNSSPNPYY